MQRGLKLIRSGCEATYILEYCHNRKINQQSVKPRADMVTNSPTETTFFSYFFFFLSFETFIF
jgi:hypothetical protein